MRNLHRGFALLELAVWTVVLLPLGLSGASLVAEIHDDAVAKMLPATLLREARGPLSTWRSDGAEGVLEADRNRMQKAVEQLAARGETELSLATWKLRDVSAMACSWVLSIDPHAGDVSRIEHVVCASRGRLASRLDLHTVLRSRIGRPIGVPLNISGVGGTFVDQRVLVALAVVGEANGLILRSEQRLVVGHAAGALREEVSL